MPVAIEPHQPLERRQHQAAHRGADAPRRRATCRTRPSSSRPSTRHSAEQLPRLAFDFVRCFMRSSLRFPSRRQLLGGFLGQAAMIVRRQILPVTVAVVWTTSRPTSCFSSASMRRDRAGGLVAP